MKTKLLFLKLFLILININFIVAKSQLGGAGVMLFAQDSDGNIYTYFSQDAKGVWADFGGNFEDSDEKTFQTDKLSAYQSGAAREFSEESMQSFKGLDNQVLDETSILNILKDKSKNIIFIESADPDSRVYGLFLVPAQFEEKSLFDKFNAQRENYLKPLKAFVAANPEYQALIDDPKDKKVKKELMTRSDFNDFWDIKAKAEKGLLVSIKLDDLVNALEKDANSIKITDSSNPDKLASGDLIKLKPGLFKILKNNLSKLKNVKDYFKDLKPKYKVGDVLYINYKKIHPGQIRISQSNVDRKVANILKSGAATADKNSKTGYIYKYNDDKSIYDLKDALPVILAPEPYKIILGDGHHGLKTSLDLGAEIVPVKVIADLSDTPVDEFWKKAYSLGYAYPFNIDGKWEIPPASFKDTVNDTNRYFATIISNKVTKSKASSPAKKGSYASKYPVWLKTVNTPLFVEFPIADTLKSNGFIYDDIKYKNDPSEELVEQARMILRDNNIEQKINNKGFNFIPDKTQINATIKDVQANLSK